MTRRSSRSRPLALGIGLVVLAGLSVVVSVRAVDGAPWQGSDQFVAHVADANHLLPGAQVHVTGVHVGNVDDVEVHPEGGARITFSVRDLAEDAVRQDARAEVRPRSPLGQQLLVLHPGSPQEEPMAPGSEIALERTSFPTELDAVLEVFDEETVADTRDVVRALGGGFLGTGPDLDRFLEGSPELLEQLEQTSDILVGREDRLIELIRSGSSLTERLEGRSDAVASGVRDTGRTLSAMSQGDGLERTLTAAPDGLAETSAAFDRLAVALDPTGDALEDIAPGVEVLSAAMPDIRTLLRDGVTTLDDLTDVAESADGPLRALQPAISELRPVLTQLETTVTELAPAIEYLAPYGPEINQWFRLGSDVIGHGDDKSNWLRFVFGFGEESTSNLLPGRSPLVNSAPYPAPGEAATMKERYQLLPGEEQN